jgi:hypothetical protein
MQTGLTAMEQALLSEEEKMITLKNRGLAWRKDMDLM